MREGENIHRLGPTDVYLNVKELFYQNNNVHFGPIRLLLYKKSFCIEYVNPQKLENRLNLFPKDVYRNWKPANFDGSTLCCYRVSSADGNNSVLKSPPFPSCLFSLHLAFRGLMLHGFRED